VLTAADWIGGVHEALATSTSVVRTGTADMIVNGVFRTAYTPQVSHIKRLLVYTRLGITFVPGGTSNSSTSTSAVHGVTIKGANTLTANKVAQLIVRVTTVGTWTGTTSATGTYTNSPNTCEIYMLSATD
jgi:hypothetical protein